MDFNISSEKSSFGNDNIKWLFNELIKTLIWISLPAKKQRYVCGVGVVGDEMVEDFDTYYVMIKVDLIEQGFISEAAKTLLDQIDTYTEELTIVKDDDFWDEIEIHDEWENLRLMAKKALIVLGKNNFELKVNHEKEIDEKDKIIIQRTKIELIDPQGKVIE